MTPIILEDPRLRPVWDKVQAGQRLDRDDALAIYRTHDLLGAGQMANYVCEQRHGNRAWRRLDLQPPPASALDTEARIDELLTVGERQGYEVALRPQLTGHTYLKDVAVARLLLDRVPHIQARLCPQVENICLLALRFGADTLAGPDARELLRQARACGREVTDDAD